MPNLGSTQFLQFNIQYASIALLYYDYALTFPMEVKYIWGERFRLSTMLYIWCRYGLVANVVYLLTISDKIRPGCDAGYKVSSALSVLGRTAIIVVWSARTYAVFAKSRIILAYFTILGLACIGLDIAHVPIISCRGNSSQPLVGGVLSILMCIFEITSVGLTTFRSVQALRVGGAWKNQKNSFIYLVFEQGLVYFSVVSVFTIASLALNIRIPGGFLQRLLNALTLPLSGLMTARFLLHLRKWEAKHSAFTPGHDTETGEHTATAMQFNSVIGTVFSIARESYGEDPVRKAERDYQADVALGEAGPSRITRSH